MAHLLSQRRIRLPQEIVHRHVALLRNREDHLADEGLMTFISAIQVTYGSDTKRQKSGGKRQLAPERAIGSGQTTSNSVGIGSPPIMTMLNATVP